MSSTKEEFRHDSEKAPRELEREIDAARAHMQHTLDLLERKLSPGEIIDEVLHLARRDGGGFARNLTAQIQNNPLPTLLAGVGLVWLMSASNQPPPPPRPRSGNGRAKRAWRGASDGAGRAAHGTLDAARHAGEGAHELGQRAQEVGQGITERVREASSEAGHRMHEMADSARDRAQHMREAARRRGRQARNEYQNLMHEQPLLIGGLGLALGAALGAMVPRTQAEDEWLGEYSESVKRQAEQEGRHQYERAKETAQRAAGAAQEELSEEQRSSSESIGGEKPAP